MLLLAAALLALGGADGPRLQAGLIASQGQRWFNYEDLKLPTTGLSESEISPRLGLTVPGEVEVDLDYAPNLYLPLVLSPAVRRQDHPFDDLALLHTGHLALKQTRGLWRLRAAATGSIGKTDLVAASLASGQAVPTTALTLETRTVQAGLGLDGELDRRTTLHLDLSGISGGGIGSSSALFPSQTGVTAGASADWRATRTQVWSLQAAGTVARTDAAATTTVPASHLVSSFIRAGVGARDTLGRHLLLGAAAGVVGMQSVPSTGTAIRRVFPWAEATGTLGAIGPYPSFALRLAMDPVVDRLSGVVDVRAGVDGRVGLTVAPWRVEAGVAAFVLQPWIPYDGNTRTLLTNCSLRVGYPVSPSVTLAATGQAIWQHFVGPPAVATAPSFQGINGGLEVAVDLR